MFYYSLGLWVVTLGGKLGTLGGNSGWYADDLYWCTPSSYITFCMRPDIRLNPWSDWIDTGNPTKVKNLTRECTIFEVFILLTHNCEDVTIASLSFGKWFHTIELKGSPQTGIGCRGTAGIGWLGLPTIWQTWHDLQNGSHLSSIQASRNFLIGFGDTHVASHWWGVSKVQNFSSVYFWYHNLMN